MTFRRTRLMSEGWSRRESWVFYRMMHCWLYGALSDTNSHYRFTKGLSGPANP